MRRISIFVLALLLSAATYAQKQLVILHTNDTHSTIYPLNENLADTAKAGRGGFVRRVAMIKAQRQQAPDLLLFDSGDFSQGSPYYTLYKGDVEIELMNRMGYDAGTIGNHEFDYGLENMARLFKKANFPIVCSNYDFTGTPVEGTVKDYVILKRDGLKIGVFAVCPKMAGLVSAENYRGVTYKDPVEEAKRVVALLKAKKCDMIICLSHLGWLGGDEFGDCQFVAATEGIDLVLGGHSHSYFEHLEYVKNAAGKLIPIDQNGKHAIYVGKMTVTLQKR